MASNVGTLTAALELDTSKFNSGLDAASASFKNLASNLAEISRQLNIPDITNAAGQFGHAITSALSGVGEDASWLGANLPLSYAAGIRAGENDAVIAASAMALSTLDAASGNLNGADALGKIFATGLASGILAGQAGVIAAAIEVARAAANAVRSELSIHSPSRVTKELGEFFDLGFIRGVEDMTPDIRDAIRAAVYVEPPAGAAYGAGREAAPTVRVSGQPIDYDALADAMNQRQVALYMNDRRMAQVMAAETARAQSSRNRSIALGYGK